MYYCRETLTYKGECMYYCRETLTYKGECMYYCRETLTYKGPVMSTVSKTAALCFIERWTLERVVCSETSYKTKEDNLSKIERSHGGNSTTR